MSEKKAPFTVYVVGLGLIGGSLAAALRRANPQWRILGFDADGETRRTALTQNFIHESADKLEALIPRADLVVLAVPVCTILELIPTIGTKANPGTMIMDVGSTKQRIVKAMDGLPQHLRVLGGHPMTGKLSAGVAGADADLFQNKKFVLTPSARTDEPTLAFGKNLVKSIGSLPIVMDAARHDALVAIISHLPHILPVALLNTADSAEDSLVWQLAAGGFKTSTDKAGKNIPMWRDVLLTNPEGIIGAIRSLQRQLDRLITQIGSGDEASMQAILENAAQTWEHHFGQNS